MSTIEYPGRRHPAAFAGLQVMERTIHFHHDDGPGIRPVPGDTGYRQAIAGGPIPHAGKPDAYENSDDVT